jgi:CBS domain-containing protein
MLVKELPVRDITSVDKSDDVIDALTVMYRKNERILPVLDGEDFVGTVRISDYIKLLKGIGDRDPLSIPVSDIMDNRPAIFSPNTPIEQVIDRVCEKGTYGIPVMSGHGLIEMIRREDILRYFLPLLKGRFKVNDAMSYSVSTHSIHEPLETLGDRILSGVERRIVIMDYHKIEGIITIQDLANVLLSEKVDLSNMSVRDILIPNPLTVSKCDDVVKAGNLMLEWKRWGIPVMGVDLEGIVRDKDIVQRIDTIR